MGVCVADIVGAVWVEPRGIEPLTSAPLARAPFVEEKGTVAYLFGVSFSSVKRYARMLSSIVNSGQAQPTCTDDGCCAPLPGRSPLHSNNLPMAPPGQRIAESA